MKENSDKETSLSEISTMVQRLYSDALVPAGVAKQKLRTLYSSISRSWQRSLWDSSMSYLTEGIRVAAQKISSLPNQIKGSEMVNYWKDFIRGMPEYAALVRAKKFQEIENVLTTLARHNEIFGLHEDRIQEIQKVLRELRDEEGK